MRVYVGPGCGPGCGCGCFLAPFVIMGYLAFWLAVFALAAVVVLATWTYFGLVWVFWTTRIAWARRQAGNRRGGTEPPETQARYSNRR